MSAPVKPKYRTTNWKAYNAALKTCGWLLIWLDKDMCWHGNASGRRGRSTKYSEAAIQFYLTIKGLFFKLFGERVMARDFDRQVAELQVRAAIPNRFTRLGTPTTVAMA